MTAESELKSAFSEVGVQVKSRVKSLNGTAGLWTGTRAAYDALKAAGQTIPGAVYITVG